MAAVTPSVKRSSRDNKVAIIKYYGTGGSNADATLTTTVVPHHKSQRLVNVIVSYSGAATQTGVTSGIDSGIGASYDVTLNTGSANAQVTTYLPSTPIWLFPDDAVVVTALAGGSGVTATIQVNLEEYGG